MMLKNRSILVTGGAGFIGSHLVERLLLDNEVTVLDNFSSGRIEFLEPYRDIPDFHLLTGDLMNPKILDNAVSGKDFIFHLAANPDVKLGSEDTHVHLEQNVLATYNLLEAMRKNDVRQMAFTSTSTVYGEAAQVPTPEDYGPLLPISLYGASKLSCEALISSYCHTFQMQSWIYRFANIVGERGTHGVLVDFIRKLRENSGKLEILGSGKQRKSYLEVKDCIRAMIHAVEHSSGEVNVFNIGSEDSVDVTEIADIVVGQMGLDRVEYNYTGGIDGRGWRGDVKLMLLSIEKIKRLGWSPELGSARALEVAVRALLKDD
ncbi:MULTISPECIES: NAD-dependent epimerase/dehydratase family protein [Methanothrix]|jgi:UDP-glucose 4-epimerase|uniref:NAD-dependent epimerase/dehydratase n=2 Tax=Methanothrix soehngenii TaxID=2223 RepID=F4BUD5_METSG|nr:MULTISPECIES: NAD-dependent epimerase/dehydratase family protein [Methanothrix]AEB69512.1 NAD-dependent epimerase/dehydratase [Methanothrix soehngenii GP6]MDY0413145.1 NAD-dependent epimerase/dehydratase family protein [Methanothrix soehngenii]